MDRPVADEDSMLTQVKVSTMVLNYHSRLLERLERAIGTLVTLQALTIIALAGIIMLLVTTRGS